MGSFIGFTGNLREGAKQMREALDVIEKTGDAVSIAMISDFLALAYSRMGEFTSAEQTIERALQFAGDADPISQVDVQIAQAGLDLERGDAETGRRVGPDRAPRAQERGACACVAGSHGMCGGAGLSPETAPEGVAPPGRGRGA